MHADMQMKGKNVDWNLFLIVVFIIEEKVRTFKMKKVKTVY